MNRKILLSVLFSILSLWLIAQTPDSTNTIPTPDDDFNLFLLMFGLAALSLMAGMFLIAVIVSLIVLAAFFGLMLLGVISASFLIGYYKKSLKNDFVSFVIIGLSLFSAIIGMLLFASVIQLFEVDISTVAAVCTGFITGAMGGFISAKLILKLLNVFVSIVSKRFE